MRAWFPGSMATDYRKLAAGHPAGAPPIPVLRKKALMKKWSRAKRRELKESDAWRAADGYGVRCDGLTVVDVDSGSREDALEELGLSGIETYEVRTMRGSHIYFNGATKYGRFNWGEVISGRGHYVVGPGSKHPDGVEYAIANNAPIAQLPAGWRPPQTQGAELSGEMALVTQTQRGARDNTFNHLAGRLVGLRLPRDIVENTVAEANSKLAEPLPNVDLQRIVESAWSWGVQNAILDDRLGRIQTPAALQNPDGGLWLPWDWGTVDTPPAGLVSTKEGRVLLAQGFNHVLYGVAGSGKSFIAQYMLVCAIREETRVVYIDHEMSMAAVRRRLRGMQAVDHVTDENCHYYNGHPPIKEVLRWLDGQERTLIIMDSIGEGGGHTNDADVYAEWHEKHVKPYLRAGHAVLALDHDVRSKAGQKDRAQHGGIGTVVKHNVVDVSYQTRDATWTVRGPGRSVMTLRKDRHGLHEEVPTNTDVAYLDKVETTEGRTKWSLCNAVQDSGNPETHINIGGVAT